LGGKERRIQANLLTTFYGVGQGLFCSNQINFIDKKSRKIYPFSFIYDCGTLSAKRLIEESTDRFWKMQKCILGKNDFIDLFVLSHFHSDHFNGLKFLLDNNKRIKVAVIPYLDPVEKLLVALDEWLNLSGVISDDELLEIMDFVLNPERFFENKVEILVLLKGNDTFENFKEREIGIGEDFGENLNRDFVDEVRFYLKMEKDEVRKEVDSPCFIRRFGLWQLNFLYPRDRKLTSNIKKIKERLKKENVEIDKIKRIEIEVKKKNAKKIKDGDVNFVFEFEKSSSNCSISLNNFRELLKEAGIDVNQRNQDSIVCCHFPVNLGRRKSGICKYKLGRDGIAQLYTGDIPFDLLKKVINILAKEEYCLFQVPHHGSGGSYWGFQTIKRIRSWYWIVSAGVKNIYGHPSIDVIADIYNICFGFPIWVNEYMDFSLNAIVEWNLDSKCCEQLIIPQLNGKELYLMMQL